MLGICTPTKEGSMKQRNIAYGAFIALSMPVLVWACPFTFINDGEKPLIIANLYQNARLIQPGETLTIEAPMKSKVNFELDSEKKYAHSRQNVYVQSEEAGNFKNAFILQEAACGKGSVVKFSELAKMSETERSGRFTVTDLSKHPLVTEKGNSNE